MESLDHFWRLLLARGESQLAATALKLPFTQKVLRESLGIEFSSRSEAGEDDATKTPPYTVTTVGGTTRVEMRNVENSSEMLE